MTLLLDTQIAIWWRAGSRHLHRPVRNRLEESACVLSAASIREVASKHRLGKLAIAPARLRDRMLAAGSELLPVSDCTRSKRLRCRAIMTIPSIAC